MNKYLKVLIVCVFILLVAVQAGKSFVLDEIDFPIVSHTTSQTHKPLYYRGEPLPTNDGLEHPLLHVGTYHPTLYINSLAIFIKVFGYNEVTIRFFGIICTLISGYLLILILRLLTRKNHIVEVMFLGLFLLNPYTVANTTLPDIDSTILPVLILLFIYISLKYLLQMKEMGNKVMLILASLFALALWSKLTTPLIIPPFLACLAYITSKDIKKSLLFALKVTLLGAIAFGITYFLYCKMLGLSTTYTYHFLLDSFTKGTSKDGPLTGVINNLANIRLFVYWITLPLLGLFGISFIGVMLNKDTDEKAKIQKLLIVFGILVTIFYIALIAPFGGFFKYPFPVFGILILTIVFFYDQRFRSIKVGWPYALIATSLGFILEKIFWRDSMFLNGKPFNGLVTLLVMTIVVYILLKPKTWRTITSSLFVLFIFFTIGFQFSISRIQAIVPYSTKYLYGQTGMEQATSYLRANTDASEPIWAMKDVGYYTNNKYYESYGYYFDKSLEGDLIDKLKGGKVRYYVVTTGIGQDNINYYSNIKTILDANAVQVKQYGNFIIYKSKE